MTTGQLYPITPHIREFWKEKPGFLYTSGRTWSWLMFAVESGCFSYVIDGVEGEAASGDIVFCPPDVEFSRRIVKPLTFFYFSFSFAAEDQGTENRTLELLRKLFAFKFTSSEQERLYNNYRQLRRAINQHDARGEHWLQHLVNDLWLLFQNEAESLAPYDKLSEDWLMKEAKTLIDRHAFRETRLQDIADFLHIHPVQFSRRFRHVFGMTPSRYLVSLRMDKAKGLLVQSEYTLDHIARLCGYENGFYFSRAFTRHCKINPSQYRKLYRPQTL